MASKRQLQLPCLPRSRTTRAQPVLKAKRDWGEGEFLRALARHGLHPVPGGFFFVDGRGRHFEGVVRHDPLRINRRATLAKILREQEQRQNRASESRQNRGGEVMAEQQLSWSGQQDSNLHQALENAQGDSDEGRYSPAEPRAKGPGDSDSAGRP